MLELKASAPDAPQTIVITVRHFLSATRTVRPPASTGTPGLNGIHIIGGGKTTIRKCAIWNFSLNGVNLVGTSNARVVIEDTLLLNNGGGLNIQGAGGVFNSGLLKDSFLENNTNFATQATGPVSLILTGSTLIGSPFSIIATGAAAVISYGNNLIRNAGLPTQTLTLQ